MRQRRSPRPSAVVAPIERYNSFIARSGGRAREHARHRAGARRDGRRSRCAATICRSPVRYALFAKLAQHLEARLGLQRPDYFSEERFVLNLTAVVLGIGARTPSAARAGQRA